MLVDSNMRVIDIRDYNHLIQKKYEEKSKISNNIIEEDYQYGDKVDSWKSYRFRCDPVPYTRKKHYGRSYRKPKTFSELRDNVSPDYKDYVRPTRRYLPTTYDDIGRRNQRSWKEQSKKKKQWM
jgi:hypothetical protein